MKNLKETAERLKKASLLKEKIILYGDADLDGITSVIILKKTLERMGVESKEFFVDREKRGYGLSEKSIDMIKEESPALIVSLDCGISNFKGIEKANREGFEVIIVDHHTPLGKLPPASLIVCPKQEERVFTGYSNGGLALKLSLEILEEEIPEFYELAALSIVGDMMPQEGENETILKKAFSAFPQNEALKVLGEILEASSPKDLFDQSVSLLNVTEMIEGIPRSFTFLLSEEKESEKIAKELIEEREKRRKKTEKIEKDVERMYQGEEIVFLGKEDWSSYLLGKAASKLLTRYKKPIFLYKKGKEESRGTVRVPSSTNAIEAMKSCQDILDDFGGHPPAAGFSLKNKNLEEFKKRLIDYFSCEK